MNQHVVEAVLLVALKDEVSSILDNKSEEVKASETVVEKSHGGCGCGCGC